MEHYLREREGIQEELIPVSRPLAQTGPGAPVQASFKAAQMQQSFLGSCPECGTGQLAYEEGCVKCHVCGFSECG